MIAAPSCARLDDTMPPSSDSGSETSVSSGGQEDVERFLGDGSAYAAPGEAVERITTHGAVVFLAGDQAYKMKRAVSYPGMDFSTLERRRRACLRELEINRSAAPEIYLDVVAVTREADGTLALDGAGQAVEWLVHMRRFAQEDLLAAVADAGRLTVELAEVLACEIAKYHKTAPKVPSDAERQTAAGVVRQTGAAFAALPDTFPREDAAAFTGKAGAMAGKLDATLRERMRHGHVRRCHGDLHLHNVVLVEGRPRLFDAIEFNESFARIDVFYDLAFLLMDLEHAGLPCIANTVFNRYLSETRHDALLSALSTLPLFLSCRAAVRAMVAGWRAQNTQTGVRDGTCDAAAAEARGYLSQAIAYLSRPTPRLVAIGGLSGTGKTTLARALAPEIGARPGAVHLRTDLERKAVFNVVQTQRLGDEAYRENVSDLVYGRILKKAECALRAGHCALVDGVFMKPANRTYAERLARRLGVRFTGVWLTAAPEIMKRRVAERRGDASDATVETVDLQLEQGSGPVRWTAVSTQGGLADVVDTVRAVLAAPGR
jgi:hypothetical protein